ncbi:solanesyl-diphosphate synthase [Trypanosoma cruzi]|nr:solanesyl-diphosphate synthase [Trypanosoma cruzi]
MPTLSYLWTRGIYMQCAPERELLTIQASIKKRQRDRLPPMNSDNGSPIHSATSHQPAQAARRAADAPHDLSNCPTKSSRRAMELIRQRRSTVVRRSTDSSALGQLYEESERGRSRDVRAVNVGAENVPGRAIQNLLLHARTADERGELCGLFGGNRSGAIDPTAVRQDAAVYVGNGSTPAGNGDSRVTKVAARSETKEEMNQVIRSRTDWKERVVFRLAWITASRLFEIAALTPTTISH